MLRFAYYFARLLNGGGGLKNTENNILHVGISHSFCTLYARLRGGKQKLTISYVVARRTGTGLVPKLSMYVLGLIRIILSCHGVLGLHDYKVKY